MTFSGCERINNSLGLSSAKSECPKCQCKEQAETVREIMSRRYPKTRTAMMVSAAILIPIDVGFWMVVRYASEMATVASYISNGALVCAVAYSGYTYLKEAVKEREDIMATSDNGKNEEKDIQKR